MLLTVFVAILLTGIGYGPHGWLQGAAAVENLLAADAQSVVDVSRLLLLPGEAADIRYLRQAARSVKVEDLLERLVSVLEG